MIEPRFPRRLHVYERPLWASRYRQEEGPIALSSIRYLRPRPWLVRLGT